MLPEGPSSHYYPLQKLGWGCCNEAFGPDLDRRQVGPLLLCWSTTAAHSTVSSTGKNNFCEVDHKTRFHLGLVEGISDTKTSFWSRSTYIFQPRRLSGIVAFTLADVVAGNCSALLKGMMLGRLNIELKRALMVTLLPSRVTARCFRTWLCLLQRSLC